MKYEIVAFYREDKSEVEEAAERMGGLYQLRWRCEKTPSDEKSIAVFVGEECVLCLFERESFGFYRLMKYVYALDKPVLLLREEFPLEKAWHLRIPVGYLQESKEAVVWANFLQRRCPDCRIELLLPREKDEYVADKVRDNAVFMEGVLKRSEARYERVEQGKSFERTLVGALREEASGMVFMMRPFRFFAFYYPHVLRLYRRYARCGVVMIPRNDALYVPCH